MAELKSLFTKAVAFVKKPTVSHTLVVLAAKSKFASAAVAAVLAALGVQ